MDLFSFAVYSIFLEYANKHLKNTKNRQFTKKSAVYMVVRVTGIEPAASWSQTTRATSCATPGNAYVL